MANIKHAGLGGGAAVAAVAVHKSKKDSKKKVQKTKDDTQKRLEKAEREAMGMVK